MKRRYSACLNRFESQLDEFFKEALRDVPPASLLTRIIPDKWSAAEHLAHLGRYQEVFQERIGQILGGQNPSIPRYRAEEDPLWPEWAQLPIEKTCANLLAARRVMIERLRKLKKEDFRKTGIHPKFGEMPLSLWMEFFLIHEGHHLYLAFQQIRRS